VRELVLSTLMEYALSTLKEYANYWRGEHQRKGARTSG
jgi:hypothetical protein